MASLASIFPIGKIDVSSTKTPPSATHAATVSAIGALVRQTRLENGIDQATAAGLAGVGVRFLGDLERGKPNLRLGLALQVLHRLGLELWIAPRGWRPEEPR